MSNPIFIDCEKDTWTKVATNVTSGQLHKWDKSPYGYLQTYRLTGEPPPTVKEEGIAAFVQSEEESIGTDEAIDVYLYSLVDDGRVRVDV